MRINALPHNASGLVRSQEIPEAGHWLQQEAPEAVNVALLAFLSPELNRNGGHK